MSNLPRCAKCDELILPNQIPWEWDDHKYYHLECQPSYDIPKHNVSVLKDGGTME